jgi:hypothetical protein
MVGYKYKHIKDGSKFYISVILNDATFGIGKIVTCLGNNSNL